MAFDKEPVKKYESWFFTQEGVYADEREKELLLHKMRFKQGESVLEVGCGTGRYIEYLNDLGLSVTGIEPMEELVKIARQKSKISPDQIIKGSFENLPFPDKSFDNVISIIAIQFSIDIKKALSEMIRVAKNKIGIGFLNKNSFTNFFNTKERRRLYKEAVPLTAQQLKNFIKEIYGNNMNNIEIYTGYTIYLPVNIGYFFPVIDDILEKINLPFGDYAVMIIKNKR